MLIFYIILIVISQIFHILSTFGPYTDQVTAKNKQDIFSKMTKISHFPEL